MEHYDSLFLVPHLLKPQKTGLVSNSSQSQCRVTITQVDSFHKNPQRNPLDKSTPRFCYRFLFMALNSWSSKEKKQHSHLTNPLLFLHLTSAGPYRAPMMTRWRLWPLWPVINCSGHVSAYHVMAGAWKLETGEGPPWKWQGIGNGIVTVLLFLFLIIICSCGYRCWSVSTVEHNLQIFI